MVLVTILGLARYLYRADLPISARYTGSRFIIEEIDVEAGETLPSTLLDDSGFLVLKEVNGFPTGNPWHVRLALAGSSVRDAIEVRIEGLEGPLPDSDSLYMVSVVKGSKPGGVITFSLLALFTLGLAGFLIRERDRHLAAIPLALGLAVLGASIALDEFGAPLPLGPGALLPGVLWSFLFPLLSPLILSFGSRFPTESTFWKHRSWIRTSAWCVAGLLGAGTAVGSLIYINSHSLAGFRLVKASQHAHWLLMIGCLTLLLYGLIREFRESKDWSIRNQIRWVLTGMIFGSVPPLLIIYLPRVFNLQEVTPNFAAVFFLLLIPVCLVVAVVRHQLLDISLAIRQGLMYGPATLGGSIIFGSLSLPILLWLITRLSPGSNIQFNPGTLFALALYAFLFSLVYEPLRKRYWRFVDQRFFRTKYSFGRTVREFNEKLGMMLTGDSVIQYLHEVTLRTFKPQWVMFVDSEGRWRDTWKHVQEPDKGAEPKLSLSFPELDGLELWVGPKTSGMAYHDYDRALLSSLAGLASTALQRELLQRRLLEEKTETERLVTLNQLKDDFLSLVSHDLRSPLSAIILGADLIIRRGAESEEEVRRADAIRIKRNAHRMGQMVERLLHAARVEAGRVEPQTESCHLHVLAATVFERHELMAENAGITLDNEVPGDVVITTDPILLQEAVSNLVDNALKVSERGSRVRIGAEERNGHWIVFISDDGPGIPEDKIADLFVRGSISGTMERTAGFGLGLYLVDQLIRLLDGSLELVSTSSQGTTFAIHLKPWTDDEEDPDS